MKDIYFLKNTGSTAEPRLVQFYGEAESAKIILVDNKTFIVSNQFGTGAGQLADIWMDTTTTSKFVYNYVIGPGSEVGK